MGKTVIAGQSARSFRRRATLIAILTLILASVWVSRGEAAAPSNDDFNDATTISTTPFNSSLDMREATKASDDPDCFSSGHTVWYSFTPEADGTVMASTAGSDFDAVIGVYTGSRGSLTEVACNDDMGPALNIFSAYVQFPVSAGVTYFFMVGTPFNLDAATLALNVDERTCPGSEQNGGFENGDLTNWTADVPADATAAVTPFHGGDAGTVYMAQEGTCFALLTNDGGGNVTSISRMLNLAADQTITGEAALDSQGEPGDTSYNDIARVRIYDAAGTQVAEPLTLDSGTMTYHADSPMTAWSFTATSTASYRLAFETISGPLGGSQSVALFDEPDTIVAPTFTMKVNKTGSGTVMSDPAGIDCGSDCTEPYSQGTSVALTASAATGWSFRGWSGDCSGTACTVSMTQDRTVTATFKPVLSVTKTGAGSGTVQSNDGGISCGADCSMDYPAGTEVELSAVAGSGSAFGGWSGACSGTGSCTLTMNSPKSVTASFLAITSLSYTGAQVVDVGAPLQLAAKLTTAPACLTGKTISFSLDDDPTTAALDGPYTVTSGVTDGIGVAQTTASTTGWREGTYILTAALAPSEGCAGSSAEATLAVAGSGASADGGGWYTLPDAPRVNFAFAVRPIPGSKPGAYTGSFLIVDGRWRLKGTISDYSNAPGGNKAASGAGDLFYWDSSTKSWVASGPATFTITFRDGAQGSGKKPDLFGAQINHMVWSPPEPSSLPNSAPQTLRAGDVRVK